MVCATAEELQARLTLRALWPTARELEAAAQGDVGSDSYEAGQSSALHRMLREEVNDTLRDGLARRLKRLEGKVELLWSDPGLGKAKGSKASSGTPKGEKSLSRALSRALKTAETAARPPAKVFAPSIAHVKPTLYWLGEIAEVKILEGEHAGQWLKCKIAKVGGETGTYDITVLPTDDFGKMWSDMDVEDIGVADLRKVDCVDVGQTRDEEIRETIALKATLENLTQNLGSRERQIGSLQQQLATVKSICAEGAEKAKLVEASAKRLEEDPALVKQAAAQRTGRRKARVEEMTANMQRAQEQAKRYQALAQQQRAFFLQSERVAVSGGQEAITRHPAGEVALTLQPPSISDEQPEVWDVGSAVANPYVTDSWPFEPNVLARRAPQEGSMDPFEEETPEDLDERPRFRNPFGGRGLPSLRMPGHESDEDDDYGGPTATSRSL